MNDYLKTMEEIPAQAYLGAALGAIGLSALLRLLGKKDAAVFVGQWPPTFILFALVFKILRPSDEDAPDNGYRATQPTTPLITATS
jgi:hypothetical protein